jgi:SAM-dependent methyltransferase
MIAARLKRFPRLRRAVRVSRERYWDVRGSSLNESHVRKALRAHGRAPKSVLVVGCNDGTECAMFRRLGAERVHGVDPIDEIGSKHLDPAITYIRGTAEQLLLPDGMFDLVFSFATLEHVHGLEEAYGEMARVLASGGTLYTLAAPLWYSPYGNHCEHLFRDEPWIHLRMTRDEIVATASQRGLTGEAQEAFVGQVDYMLDPRFFNRRHARDYLAASSALGLSVELQEVRMEPRALLRPDFQIDEPPEELLAATHRFVAHKE